MKINPVKATLESCGGIENCGIQEMNETCYGICGAFTGTNDQYNLLPGCGEACAELIDQKRLRMYGVGHCDHEAPYPPVLWQETPRWVATLTREGKATPKEALKYCLAKCEGVPNLYHECRNNCKLDYSAIVKENFGLPRKPSNHRVDDRELEKMRRQHPAWFWIGFGIAVFLVLVATIVFLLLLRKK
jgi:hypothetical protein